MIYLIIGLFADKAPNGKLAHYLPPEYLAFAFTGVSVALSAAVMWVIIGKGGRDLFIDDKGNPLLTVDLFGAVFFLIASLGALVVMLMSIDFFADKKYHRAEYYTLLMFASAAIMLVSVSRDFITIYLSLEFLSIISYALAAYLKTDAKSSEAGIKYLIFGAVSSAVMLYGMSILYGLTGATNLVEVSGTLKTGVASYAAAALAVLFVLVGLGFKVAMVPFHLWAPDVYEGAPTPVTAFLSVCSKAAGLAILVRVLWAIPPSAVDWYSILALIAGLSMTLGNLVAISQSNIKRMLAYSSIAHIGYILVGVLAAAKGAELAMTGVLVYIFSYLFMNLGAFTVAIAVGRKTGSDEIKSFAGLIRRAPLYAGSMVVFLLSLAGLPPTGGFLGKFYIFAGAIQESLRLGDNTLFALAIIAIANSVVSVYYYFNVVRTMFFGSEENAEPIKPTPALGMALVFTMVITIAILIFAHPVTSLAQLAAKL
jgi:proton-translocating NADH-quinone oxidoreductase chain N